MWYLTTGQKWHAVMAGCITRLLGGSRCSSEGPDGWSKAPACFPQNDQGWGSSRIQSWGFVANHGWVHQNKSSLSSPGLLHCQPNSKNNQIWCPQAHQFHSPMHCLSVLGGHVVCYLMKEDWDSDTEGVISPDEMPPPFVGVHREIPSSHPTLRNAASISAEGWRSVSSLLWIPVDD